MTASLIVVAIVVPYALFVAGLCRVMGRIRDREETIGERR